MSSALRPMTLQLWFFWLGSQYQVCIASCGAGLTLQLRFIGCPHNSYTSVPPSRLPLWFAGFTGGKIADSFLPPAVCIAPLVTGEASQHRGRLYIDVSLLFFNLAAEVCGIFSKKSLLEFWWLRGTAGACIILGTSWAFGTHKEVCHTFIETFV